MKKVHLLLAAMVLSFPVSTFAQNNDDEEVKTVFVVDDDDEAEENKTQSTTTTTIVDDDDDVVPEGMLTNVDSLLLLYNNGKYLEVDPDCNYPDVNRDYEPEVYQERLRKMPTIIEMPYNPVVQRYIDRYATKLRRSVSLMLGASNFYMPIFEQALETYNVPLELKYLPVIESALNPRAVSHAGAAGLWQFMLSAGKQYGLEVNTLVDERRDPIKSSYAAAHLLSDLYHIFGDWSLAIAAYNCGPDNVNKAIHRAGGKKDYWEVYPYLPKETRGYVPAFIAANYIMNYYCEHNICPMKTTLPQQTDTILVSRDVHFEQIAKVLNIDVKMIEELNPQYRRNIINGGTKPSVLRLPSQDITSFVDHEDEIYNYNPKDYLTKRTTTAVEETETTNDKKSSRYSRHKKDEEKTQKTDYKKSKYDKKDKKKDKKKKEKKEKAQNHTVKDGETLGGIAQRNGTTVEKLRKLNPGIKGDLIRAGKSIRVK